MKAAASHALALALSLFAVVASASAQTFTNSITLSDPTQNGRLLRDGVPSVAGIQKPYPGTINPGSSFHYDAYTFVNPFATATAFTLTLSTTETNISNEPFSETYLGSFNPANIATNYLADAGVSSVAGIFISYSFNIPANSAFVVVVNETNPNAGVSSYSITLSSSTNAASVPDGSKTIILLGLALAGLVLAQRVVTRRANAC